LVERIRATGRGLGGVLVRPGRRVGTDPQLLIELDGLPHVIERPLRAQFALLAASRADAYFNLAYARGTADLASLMASAADCVIAEPETVDRHSLPSSVLQTSGVTVTYLVRTAR
jgi:acetate CoA/acetoacetate CoA-transferase alpha subunit